MAKVSELSGVYAMSFIINILRRGYGYMGFTVGKKPLFLYQRQGGISDVDYQIDFDFCEFVYNQRRKSGWRITQRGCATCYLVLAFLFDSHSST